MRPTRDEALMQHAEIAASRGTCSRASVGVVVAREGRILVTGYNGAPSGMHHCDHTCDCPGPQGDWSSYNPPHPPESTGHGYWCASLQPCGISVHAEANAVAWAARVGAPLHDADMFTTWAPCNNCSMLIINSGITRVVYRNEYRDPTGLVLLRTAGIALEHLA